MRGMIWAMLETVAPPSPTSETARLAAASLRVVLLGGFGMRPKATMSARALPLGQALAARGHTVTLIVPPWDHAADAERTWNEGGVRVINSALPAGMQLLGIPMALRGLTHAAQPDIVHIFKPKGYSGLVLPLLADTPTVLDTDDWEGAGGWNTHGHYSAPQQLLFGWQETHLPRRAAHVTTASRTLEMQQRRLGLPEAQVTYLPNALHPLRHVAWRDEESIAREAMTIRERYGLSGPTVLVYTRFVEFSAERLAVIFRRIRARCENARLLIVGESLDGHEAQIARELAPFGDAVVRAGFVPFTAVPAYLRAADAAMVPFEDTLINRAKCSVKTLDLLAVGQAVVATAVGENQHAIHHNTTGLIVPPDDADAMADAIVALLCDPVRARALGDAARARAWHEQTWTAQVRTVEAIYERVVQSRAR
jgi:glycosyltransferase involved in cell wall biosynthesis